MPEEPKFESSWRKFFKSTDYLKVIRAKGYAVFTAKELRAKSKHIPRTMVKHDYSHERPAIFKKENLNILPLKRGTYVIFRDTDNISFKALPEQKPTDIPKRFNSVYPLSSLDTLRKQDDYCSSESEVLEHAFLSSLLQEFSGASNLVLTRHGRFGSSKFPLLLPEAEESRLEVEAAQVEVDGIYENEDTVVIVEVKMNLSDNINLRQLYYPYQWAKANTNKRIVNLLLCYSYYVYRLTEFKFGDNFGDAEVAKQEFYLLDEEHTTKLNIATILKFAPSAKESVVSFPQADSMEKVIGVFYALVYDTADKYELQQIFNIDPRQINYYLSAVRYLGLIDKHRRLTTSGKRLLKERTKANKTELIFKCMLTRPVFREAFLYLQDSGFEIDSLSKDYLVELIEKYRPAEYRLDTLERRARTVKAWFKWLLTNAQMP